MDVEPNSVSTGGVTSVHVTVPLQVPEHWYTPLRV